jgi:hypothetical protein
MGVKQEGHEADHSLPMSAKVKKMWTIPPYVLLDLFFDPGGDMFLHYFS